MVGTRVCLRLLPWWCCFLGLPPCQRCYGCRPCIPPQIRPKPDSWKGQILWARRWHNDRRSIWWTASCPWTFSTLEDGPSTFLKIYHRNTLFEKLATLRRNGFDKGSFYSDKRNKGKMKSSHFVDELLKDQNYKKYAKRKFSEINAEKGGKKTKKKQKT